MPASPNTTGPTQKAAEDWGNHRFSLARVQPSSMLVWALDNCSRIASKEGPLDVLHVGCGTGRNALHLAQEGHRVTGFDASARSIELANQRFDEASIENRPTVLHHDLADGLPVQDGSLDLIVDIFVYNEQVNAKTRSAYRGNVARALRPGGLWLLGVPCRDDGFYATCEPPASTPPATAPPSEQPRIVCDASRGHDLLLFDLADLMREAGDRFALRMLWRQRKMGPMYGASYLRSNWASLWQTTGQGVEGFG